MLAPNLSQDSPVALLQTAVSALISGEAVPYLGPGVLERVTNQQDGSKIPATSTELILAMNGGREMAPRYMYEFSRAAMHVEHTRGRTAVTRFLTSTYSEMQWTPAKLHPLLAQLQAPYVVDINRDTQLLDAYAKIPHTLVIGYARLMGGDERFRIFARQGDSYEKREADEVDATLPILFKPLGSPVPDATYVASDADFVDYITELMGGFAIPPFLKERRKKKKYLLAGLPLTRDTERMVLSEIMYGATGGWALISGPNDKERRFCEKHALSIIDASVDDLVGALEARLG